MDRLDVSILISAINPQHKSALRDTLIIHLLASTGLKISELVALSRQDVETNFRQIRIKRKNAYIENARIENAYCNMLLSEVASTSLESYLSSRKDSYSALFINYSRINITDPSKQPRLTARSIQRMLKNLSLKAKVENATPTSFRTNFARELFVSDKNHDTIQNLLGHTNKGTTRNLKRSLLPYSSLQNSG